MRTMLLRVLDNDDKASAHRGSLDGYALPDTDPSAQGSLSDPELLHEVAGTPFAYWVGSRVHGALSKMGALGRRLEELDLQLPTATGREAGELRREHEDLTTLQSELADLRAELLRVAALPYKPDLDDGVLISAAPLARLFRLTKWRKDLEACWKKLEKGDYDWAHLAMAVWPERVHEACRRDRSIAIAHGVEEEYEG